MKNKIKAYHEMFSGLLAGLDLDALTQASLAVVRTLHADHQIFVAGNGAGASLADAFATGISRDGLDREGMKSGAKQRRVISLSSNGALISALGNECGFEMVFAQQLRQLMSQGDLVLLISSSGHSPNIVKAAEYAQSGGASVIGMTGFSGGKLKELADVRLHVACNVHELVCNVHSFYCNAIINACKQGRI